MKDMIPWRKKREGVMEYRHEESSFDLVERTMEHLFGDVDWGLTRGSPFRRENPFTNGSVSLRPNAPLQ